MSNHFQVVCEYGTVHGQCRCPGPNKATHRIDCDTPEKCSPPEGDGHSVAAPKRGSLEYLLRRAFDAGIMAQASATVQQVSSHDRREFLEAHYAEFRRDGREPAGAWTMPGTQPHPPASECSLALCTYPYPHSHGTD